MAKLCLCSGCPSSSAEPGLLMLSWHSQGVLGLWGSVFSPGTSGLGEEWPDKKVWLRSSVQETKFLWGDHSRKWNFKCSSLIHFSLFHISFPTKTRSPPLKIWVQRLKCCLAKPPCMYFWQTCHLRRDFSSNSIPQRDRAAASPPPCSSRVTTSTPGFILYHSQKGTKLAILALKQRLHTFATLPGGPERYAYYIL